MRVESEKDIFQCAGPGLGRLLDIEPKEERTGNRWNHKVNT